MLIGKRRRALQTWVYPSQGDVHCNVCSAEPILMVVGWQWSGELCTWMRWQELVLRGRPEDPFPAWRTVDVVSWNGRNNPGGRTLRISLLQPQNGFGLCTLLSCCTHPGAWLLKTAQFQACPPPCSSWCRFPSEQPPPRRVCLPHAWTGNSPIRHLPWHCDLPPRGSTGSSEASSGTSLFLNPAAYGKM